jgi:hypothetical protein
MKSLYSRRFDNLLYKISRQKATDYVRFIEKENVYIRSLTEMAYKVVAIIYERLLKTNNTAGVTSHE